jgi:serine/threonine protein kinase
MRHLYEYVIDPHTGRKKSVFNMTFGPKTFINKYSIDRIIIAGSHSIVYLVTKKKTNVKYICKMVLTSGLRKEEYLIPNSIPGGRVVEILEIYQAYIEGISKVYLIMEYNSGVVDGFDYVNKYGLKLREDEIKPIFREMCLAIRDCHVAGYCHGDIKLENVIITSTNPLSVKLIDFGFSFRDDPTVEKFKGGTVRYVAPEVFRESNGSRASDIWSIGAVLYYVLSNETYSHNASYHVYSSEFGTLMNMCMAEEPSQRGTIEDILGCSWFDDCIEVNRP